MADIRLAKTDPQMRTPIRGSVCGSASTRTRNRFIWNMWSSIILTLRTDDTKKIIEGPEAAERFESSMRRILAVSKDELTTREAAYQKIRRTKIARKK